MRGADGRGTPRPVAALEASQNGDDQRHDNDDDEQPDQDVQRPRVGQRECGHFFLFFFAALT